MSLLVFSIGIAGAWTLSMVFLSHFSRAGLVAKRAEEAHNFDLLLRRLVEKVRIPFWERVQVEESPMRLVVPWLDGIEASTLQISIENDHVIVRVQDATLRLQVDEGRLSLLRTSDGRVVGVCVEYMLNGIRYTCVANFRSWSVLPGGMR